MGCSKCNSDINNPKDAVKCSQCGNDFHVACCRYKPVATRSGMKSWRCDDCVTDSASVDSRSENEDSAVMELLKIVRREISDSRRSSDDNFKSLRESLSSVEEALNSFKLRLCNVEESNSDLSVKYQLLKQENEDLAKKVTDLQMEMHESQQYSRNRNIEIRGIPKTSGEDVYLILESVAKAIGITFSRGDISIAHRLPPPKNRKYHPSIVAQFISRSVKSQWVTMAKRKQLKTTDVSPSLSPGSVFVGDHLTSHNKYILGHAKNYVKSKALAFAWSADGKILVRKAVDSMALRVRSVEDVDAVAGVRGGIDNGGASDSTINTHAPINMPVGVIPGSGGGNPKAPTSTTATVTPGNGSGNPKAPTPTAATVTPGNGGGNPKAPTYTTAKVTPGSSGGNPKVPTPTAATVTPGSGGGAKDAAKVK
jgi:hypothetical protein